MGTFCFLFFAVCLLVTILMAVHKVKRDQQELEILKRNPKAWRAMKERKDAAAERKRQAMGGAALTGTKIALWLLKRR
jgi:hypothetical protein